MAKSEPNKILKAIKTLFLVALIIAASVGATFLYYQQTGFGLANAEIPEEAIPAARKAAVQLPAPIFTPLEPFTVTVRNEQTQRILYVAITLRMTDEASRRMVTEYMPEVRDRVLRKLAEQQPDRVQTPEGRQALVQSLSASLQEPYLPHNKGPDITSVLFTAFVVQ
ncbi:flagellar basal body-associated FliL family protein [Pollutimonas bauzanensis]|uniref:Flagellar protein FliL n=1 Tax=Pollutimonas bauzanensis TaxID=658167 RepID=A0A1M5Z437_9BURK|nr:flagellar basal body-associated FliL family protein [Pollutimonas bauzanensis]SHI19046.1 flagellar FliL protein [Pollutimonas bauzanensis]